MSFFRKGFTLIEILIVLTMIGIFVGATAYLTKDARIDQTKAERLAININDTIKNARNNMVIGRGVFSGSSLYPTTQRTIRIDNGSIRTIYAANSSTGTETDTNYPFFDNDGEYKIIDISVSSGVVSGNQMIGWDHTGVTMTEIIIDGKGGMQILARQGMTDISTPINAVRITAGYGVFQRSVILDRVVGRSEVVQDGGESVFSAAPPTSSCSGILPLCNGSSCTLVSGTPTTLNQPWVKDATSCGFTCNAGVSGDDCEILPPPVCASPDPSFVNIGTLTYLPSSFNQPWNYGASSCGYVCTGGYSGSGCLMAPSFSCATNPSFPKIGALSPGTPTSVNQSWSYGAINCGYACIDGFTGSGCATPPPSVTGFTTTWHVGYPGYGDASKTVTFGVILGTSPTIDWGDGTVGPLVTTSPSHTYAIAGDYTIKITGIRAFYNNLSNLNSHGKLLTVTDWGGINWSTLGSMFQYANHLTSIPVLAPDMSSVTSTASMFLHAELFNQPLTGWNTSNITNMSWMFASAYAFDQPVSHFDTSNVTNMTRMFSAATSFNQDVSSFDTSNVTDMQYMFYWATNFDHPLSTFDTSNVTNMIGMFWHASKFNQDISSWDVSNVTNMTQMFQDALLFNQPLGSWNVSNVTNMLSMFQGAAAFNRDISTWDTTKVTNMSHMFDGATVFNQPLGSWNTSNVINMSFYFTNAKAFNRDISTWNTTKVLDMSQMFQGAIAFNEPLNSWNVANVVNMYAMFDGASSFNRPLGSWNTSKVTSMFVMFRGTTNFNQDISAFDTSKVSNMGYMFQNATSFNQNISNWCVPLIGTKPGNFDTSANAGFAGNATKQPAWGTCPVAMGPAFTTTWRVGTATYGNGDSTVQFNVTLSGTSMIDWGDGNVGVNVSTSPSHTYAAPGDYTIKISGISRFQPFGFSSAYHGKLLAVTDWGGIAWTNMSWMFAYADHFNGLPVAAPNTVNVTDMSFMFHNALTFNQPLTGFNTANVTNMASMFQGAKIFNQSLASFNTANVTNMNAMFYSDEAFNQSLASFNTANVTNMGFMFSYAKIFNQSLASFNTANVVNMQAMFQYASAFNQSLATFNTSNVTNMANMFSYATVFNQSLATFNTANVTNMSWMFASVQAFNQSLSSFNTSNVTNMAGMFASAQAFNQSLASFDTANVTNMGWMFHTAKIFNQSLSSFNTAKVTDMSAMFQRAQAFNQSLASFNTANVTDMSWMFYNATAFNQPLTMFNTSKVTSMRSMFYGAAVFNQDISSFDTANVANMQAMFSNALIFNQNLSSWVVNPKVTNCITFSVGASAWMQPKPTFSNCTP